MNTVCGEDFKHQIRNELILNKVINEFISASDSAHVPFNNFRPALPSHQTSPE
jgi:hypothetical protein